MSSRSGGLTPQSSSSRRDGSPTASSSGRQGSRQPGRFDGHVMDLASQRASIDGSEQTDLSEHEHGSGGSRRRLRNSGGFLLQNAVPGFRKSPTRDTSDGKGKRKAENGELKVPKRTARGASPLGSRQNQDKRLSTNSNGRESWQSASTKQDSDSLDQGIWRDSVGRDTDPTQIVNLALNLGETRRRHASGGMLLGARDINSKRIVSSPRSNGGGLRKQLQEQRRISRVSPQMRTHSMSTRQTDRMLPDEADEDIFNASDATLARAEKAKIALELGYEYRRLLQYLPAIPKTKKHKRHTHHVEGLGRDFNPLQYIRNRKVRLREKKPLNPEVDGWRDIERVRGWIEDVRRDREAGVSRVDDRFPLPPFDDLQPLVVDGNDLSPTNPLYDSFGNNSRRPARDWTISPWDLLADVRWLDQDHNIERIEDPSGRKIVQNHSARPSKDHARIDLPSPVKDRSSIEAAQRKRPNTDSTFDHGLTHNRLRSTSSSSNGSWSPQFPTSNAGNAILEKQMMQMLAGEAGERKSSDLNGSADPKDPKRPAPVHRTTEVPIANGSPRISIDKPRHRRMSSDDVPPHLAPDIAVDSSKATSPMKRPLAARLGSFRRDRSRSMDRRSEEESLPVTRQTTTESIDKSSSGSLYLRSDAGRRDRFFRAREPVSPESRFRGIFKGGRIAELVGSEVSKVGDRLRKKESITNMSMVSPTSSHLTDESESDRESVTDGISRQSTESKHPPTSAPKYHIDNLPSFKPADQRLDDPISRQRMNRGRSAKFDMLAPPKIDMRSVSPSPSQSQGPRSRDSRDSSTNRSTQGVRDADMRLNGVLGIPGTIGVGLTATHNRPMTGLAAFSSTANGKAPWSIADKTTAIPGVISKRDIARVRAALMSSGIKAHEITRRNEEPPAEVPPLLEGLRDVIKEPLPLVPPSQEVVFAARSLIVDIEATHKDLREAAEVFSLETSDELHQRIRNLDDRVTNKMITSVQQTSDHADAFSTELTSTHPLAIKQLNDRIDSVLRKRRRKLRWLRRGAWTTVEWMVLGIMWMLWLIAVIVRVFRGAVGVAVQSVRWLFWL